LRDLLRDERNSLHGEPLKAAEVLDSGAKKQAEKQGNNKKKQEVYQAKS
jgi:hypothetical protein